MESTSDIQGVLLRSHRRASWQTKSWWVHRGFSRFLESLTFVFFLKISVSLRSFVVFFLVFLRSFVKDFDGCSVFSRSFVEVLVGFSVFKVFG